ncbi:TonB-dependent receptor [Phenylobacterium montanum]|uniref:TonB-dependent receptor n=1 Tax=Phenylobacterium montanum TaxID=2823693 RepID=A0A975FV99_9CAUL|nr:TonB-dependent receptor [Caulobacter sp. S6]QUD85945.1 TonB-dependent receptor [Caulobacter sp. S6]
MSVLTCLALAWPAAAQTVVVYGKRASLEAAEAVKREKLQIVDSVVADDIVKLPDYSVADALQRITGAQITQDRGEGANITIRGLSQIETTLNGREVFTAGGGRTLNFSDIPSELVSRIDVYKTSSASQIEGGIGGLADLETHRPFDFAGPVALASARLIHGDLAARDGGEGSVLASNRWTTGVGEVALLIDLSYQQRAWREDQESAGNPVARSDIVPGTVVIAPNGISQTTSIGQRRRTGAEAMLQWRPTPALELYAEGDYAEFRTLQDSYQINIAAAPTFQAGSAALFPGTRDLERITWTNASVSMLSFARDTIDRSKLAAVGARWSKGRLSLRADVSYTDSVNDLFFSGPFLAGTAASFSQDFSTVVPSGSVAGTDLQDPTNFRYTGVAYRASPFLGRLAAAQVDADYELDSGPIGKVSAGWRHADRRASDGSGLIFGDAALTGLPVASLPGFVMPDPYRNFFPGQTGQTVTGYLVGDLALARNAAALRAAFGVTTPVPSVNRLGQWRIGEDSDAGYLLARLRAGRLPLDGDFGLRWVATGEAVSGGQSQPSTSAIVPIHLERTDWDLLPSLNLRWRLRDGLYLRLAASRTLTRQDFSQLSPSLSLAPNPVNPTLNTGSAGNPNLKPVRSDNLDFAVEDYLGPTTAIYATGFLKHVDGFVATVSAPEVHDGKTYQVTRPQNGAHGDIRGFEVGYQQFFDFLPGAWSGLGLQANYTYVDSSTPSRTLRRGVTLQNLSKDSYNLIGLYERNRISARLAYNWRSRFLSSTASFVGVGALPVYTEPTGWLDASARYRLTRRITLSVEGVNLLGTMRRSTFGSGARPQSVWVNDTEFSLAATARF